MKIHFRNLAVMLALSLVGILHGSEQGRSPAADYLPEGRYKTRIFSTNQYFGNLVYCPQVMDPKTGKPMDLTLNLFLPPKEDAHDKRPLIIFIHGGGFTGGNAGGPQSPWGVYPARSGYVVASLEYRLSRKEDSKEVKLARAVEDTKNAIKWLRQHAQEYGLDPNRIALEGCSAGGFTALTAGYGLVDGKFDPGICAVGDMWGGMSPNQLASGGPPICIIHGTEDHLVPIDGAVKIHDRAAVVGVPCEYHPFEGYGHELRDANGKNHPSELSLPILAKFYAKHLAKVE